MRTAKVVNFKTYELDVPKEQIAWLEEDLPDGGVAVGHGYDTALTRPSCPPTSLPVGKYGEPEYCAHCQVEIFYDPGASW